MPQSLSLCTRSSLRRIGGCSCIERKFGLKRHRVAFDKRFSLGIMPGTRPPSQGDALGDVFPGLKPMGCSVFALWAIRNVQTPVTGEVARPTLWRGRARPRSGLPGFPSQGLAFAGDAAGDALEAAFAARAAFSFSICAAFDAVNFFCCSGVSIALMSLSYFVLSSANFALSPFAASRSSTYFSMIG